MKFKILKQHKNFDGETVFCEHESSSTKTPMKFSYFRPKGHVKKAIIWLSGLTCNEENFISKAGAQYFLSGTDTMIFCPDTSPRGLDLPGEHDGYDFGAGAGFYLNATTPGYSEHYKMYDYIACEFVSLIKENFLIDKLSLTGHSMGGHGALVLGLKNPELFDNISAFSPIVNPTQAPWGEKAFTGYLGEDRELWKQYDACELIQSGLKHPHKILIEQGLADEFYEEQLKTSHFEKVCQEAGQELEVHYQEGYDHSYYFISTFIEKHIKHLTQ